METRHQRSAGGNGDGQRYSPIHSAVSHEVAFGYPRDFLQNQFVYLVISPRAGGLSIGVNLNPIVRCNFNCVYCEVDRTESPRAAHFDTDRMVRELRETVELAHAGWLRQWPRYARLPEDLLKVRHVALSGDGEPTLASEFVEGSPRRCRVAIAPVWKKSAIGFDCRRAGPTSGVGRVSDR